MLGVFALAVAFVAGFLWFVATVPTEEVSINRPADGIVVLTGGASRIADAIELLAAGRGKRLQARSQTGRVSNWYILRVPLAGCDGADDNLAGVSADANR